MKNWAGYDAALRERGDITVWFDEEASGAEGAAKSGRPGWQRRYSDQAIETALQRGLLSTGSIEADCVEHEVRRFDLVHSNHF